MRRTVRLFTLLLLLGGASPTHAASSEEQETVLHVMTMNVQGLPAIVTGNTLVTKAQELIARAKLLRAMHVVAIQEDFTCQMRVNRLRDWIQKFQVFPVIRHFGDRVADKLCDSGLTTLIRRRVMTQVQGHYTHCHGHANNGGDCLASKGWQMMRVEGLSGMSVDVYNTHLDAGRHPESEHARAHNLMQLGNAIERHSEGRAVIVLGDLNLKPKSSKSDREALALFLDRTGLTDVTVGHQHPDRVDKILIRSGKKVSLTLSWFRNAAKHFVHRFTGESLSDHDPLVAKIRVRIRAKRTASH